MAIVLSLRQFEKQFSFSFLALSAFINSYLLFIFYCSSLVYYGHFFNKLFWFENVKRPKKENPFCSWKTNFIHLFFYTSFINLEILQVFSSSIFHHYSSLNARILSLSSFFMKINNSVDTNLSNLLQQ